MRVVFLYSEGKIQRTVFGSHSMEQDNTNTEVPFCDDDNGRILDDDDHSESSLCDEARKMLARRSDEPRFRTSHVDSK
jgi:hypothetical protein